MELRLACFVLAVSAISLSACRQKETKPTPPFKSDNFNAYWHAGKAEINSYNLSQSRYGENRRGKAVLIFVTEDLSRKLQVKLDDPSKGNKVNVLKLNFTKKFITGIYPYSMMLSVFTPVDHEKRPSSLKAVMSSQEWCGQVYTQMNLRGNRYAVRSHSYFEQEADEQFSIKQAVLEDELWNFIRLDHEHLPLGEIKVVPGLFYARLNHSRLEIQPAFSEQSESDSCYTYKLSFPETGRTLSIQYEKIFPYKILAWEETWKERGKVMTTTAQLDKTLYTDYWTKNKSEFTYLRDSLNLPNPY